MKIVPLRGRPAVSDIPGMLRNLANEIETGQVRASSVLAIIPRDADWPDVYGFGEHLGDHGNIAVCELAKIWFANNLVAGKS